MDPRSGSLTRRHVESQTGQMHTCCLISQTTPESTRRRRALLVSSNLITWIHARRLRWLARPHTQNERHRKGPKTDQASSATHTRVQTTRWPSNGRGRRHLGQPATAITGQRWVEREGKTVAENSERKEVDRLQSTKHVWCRNAKSKNLRRRKSGNNQRTNSATA